MTWPLSTLFAAAVLLWVDGLAGGHLAGDAIGLLVLAALAGHAGWRSRSWPLVVTAGGTVVVAVLADQAGDHGHFSAANDGVFYAVVVLGPCLIGWLAGQRDRQVKELRRQSAELTRRRAAAVRAARAAEVERIERQVDRALADRLDRIIGGVREAATGGADEVLTRLHEVEATARGALEELRSVLGIMRAPTVDAAPSPVPLPPMTQLGWPDLLLCLAGVPLAIETAGEHGPAWVNVTLAVLQGPALCLVRRRRPLLGSLPLVVLALVQTAFFAPLPPTVSWFVPGLLLTFLVAAESARVGLLVVLLEVAAITLATPSHSRDLSSLLPSGIAGVLSWGAGRFVRAGSRRAAELRATVDELALTEDAQAGLAAAEQRAELARELHDVGAHTLTVVCLQAGAVQALWERDPLQAREALGSLLVLADEALADLLASLGGLARQPSEHPLDPAALEVLASIGRVLGLDITIEVTGQPQPLVGALGQAAFRIVQEGLTNAARYAPGAVVLITVDYLPGAVDLVVRNGVGRGHPTGLTGSGNGLRGMHERVLTIGGAFESGPVDGGFGVHARLPLPALSVSSS